MRVLLLTQVLPYPPDSGPKVKTWNVLKSLARTHQVTLVSFVRGDQSGAVAQLRSVCQDVHTVPMTRGWAQDAVALGRSLTGGAPWVILRDDRAGMRQLVDRVAGSQPFDLVHADQLNMAQYALRVEGARRLLDAHNALWLLYDRLAETTRNPATRWLFRRDARLLQQYEGEMCRRFDTVLTVTDIDRHALLQAAESTGQGQNGTDPRVIPIAVDTEELHFRRRSGSANHILHIGTMFWPPNVDGIRWFVDAVLPLVRRERPDVEFDVLGANPPAEMLAWNTNGRGVRVAGYVDDPSPYLGSAAVFVVPLLAGGGMRVKILTAMAQGLPVVSTTVGCEGIDVVPGRHLLVADTAEEFAAATLRLLTQPQLAEELGLNGRKLVEQRYSLPHLAVQLEEAYQAALRGNA
jgi:glycosyltransferase involved in cell wall biosynthesis